MKWVLECTIRAGEQPSDGTGTECDWAVRLKAAKRPSMPSQACVPVAVSRATSPSAVLYSYQMFPRLMRGPP